jgi:riboflavin synthase
VNGACLTVRESAGAVFVVSAVSATLERTCIGSWQPGRQLNLERALRAGDRLGGHFVQGHVDCVGRVEALTLPNDERRLRIGLEESVWETLARQGSVTVDGVSLTVSALPGRGFLEVVLIEYTLAHTTLANLTPGDDVHIEADIIGKHVHQLLQGAGRQIV